MVQKYFVAKKFKSSTTLADAVMKACNFALDNHENYLTKEEINLIKLIDGKFVFIITFENKESMNDFTDHIDTFMEEKKQH